MMQCLVHTQLYMCQIQWQNYIYYISLKVIIWIQVVLEKEWKYIKNQIAVLWSDMFKYWISLFIIISHYCIDLLVMMLYHCTIIVIVASYHYFQYRYLWLFVILCIMLCIGGVEKHLVKVKMYICFYFFTQLNNLKFLWIWCFFTSLLSFFSW